MSRHEQPDRDRRHAEREVLRALSEGRSVAIWAGFIVAAHTCGFALLARERTLTFVAGVVAFGLYVALCARVEPFPERGPKGAIAKMSDAAFDELLLTVEREASLLASGSTRASGSREPLDADGFARLVAEALDALPDFLRAELDRNVVVTISDDGVSDRAYGMYIGGTVANRGRRHQIVIFRDTLQRDYGSDPNMLRRLVTMVVRHEMAHHLGAGEQHVSDLGLYDLRGPCPAKPVGVKLPRSLPGAGSSTSTGPQGARVTLTVRATGPGRRARAPRPVAPAANGQLPFGVNAKSFSPAVVSGANER